MLVQMQREEENEPSHSVLKINRYVVTQNDLYSAHNDIRIPPINSKNAM